jgi:voltage-gated potassium channel
MMANELKPKLTLKERVHEVIFGIDTWAGVAFDVLLLITIVMSIVAISLETVEKTGWVFDANGEKVPNGKIGHALLVTRWIFTGLFTLEYLLRIYCVKRPLKYILSFWGIIDLLAFLPEYLTLLGGPVGHFSVIRSLRLVRVFRIFSLGFFQLEADDLGSAIWRSRAKIVVFLTVVMILVTVTGTLMYELEEAMMGSDSEFESIPDGIYWAIVTMTTVGFGDIVPLSTPGKFLSAFLILAGYSLIIVPTGFVSAEVIQSSRRRLSNRICSHCLTEGHDRDAVYCKYCAEKL